LSSGSSNAGSDFDGLDKTLHLIGAKRALPFESFNYGRRKRSVYSVDDDKNCDCNEDKRIFPLDGYNKRGLPFETFNYGKRALPFETLNYGRKRALLPYEGYIMGKRSE